VPKPAETELRLDQPGEVAIESVTVPSISGNVEGRRADRLMNVTLEIPDDIGLRLAPTGGLSRKVLETFVLEELKAGRITEPELCRMLGLARIQLDGFLKAHGVFEDYTMEDFEKERAAFKSLGL